MVILVKLNGDKEISLLGAQAFGQPYWASSFKTVLGLTMGTKIHLLYILFPSHVGSSMSTFIDMYLIQFSEKNVFYTFIV